MILLTPLRKGPGNEFRTVIHSYEQWFPPPCNQFLQFSYYTLAVYTCIQSDVQTLPVKVINNVKCSLLHDTSCLP